MKNKHFIVGHHAKLIGKYGRETLAPPLNILKVTCTYRAESTLWGGTRKE